MIIKRNGVEIRLTSTEISQAFEEHVRECIIQEAIHSWFAEHDIDLDSPHWPSYMVEDITNFVTEHLYYENSLNLNEENLFLYIEDAFESYMTED